MKKATDLRIGNWVCYGETGSPVQIELISIDNWVSFGCITFDQPTIDEIKPIPLTKEWLLKLGFEKYDWVNGYFIKYHDRHLFVQFYEPANQILVFFTKVSKDSKGHKMHSRDYFVPKNSIKYVHQLQNLYFALIGKELELTP